MLSPARLLLISALLVSIIYLLPRPAAAQDSQPEELPIGHYVGDVRLQFPKFKQEAAVSGALGVATENLPTRGFGFALGAHWYPLRVGFMTLGLGGEVSKSGRDRTKNTGTEAAPVNVTVNTSFSAVSPQVSFNFGARDGWSYISGGLGWAKLTTERVDQPLPPPESATKAINYGGGARWFFKKHLAVNFDIRFHAVNPQLATATRPAYPRMTIMSWVGGISVR
jgi:Outer membrane protein beta-barrel domain